jgi:hypothetical protein
MRGERVGRGGLPGTGRGLTGVQAGAEREWSGRASASELQGTAEQPPLRSWRATPYSTVLLLGVAAPLNYCRPPRRYAPIGPLSIYLQATISPCALLGLPRGLGETGERESERRNPRRGPSQKTHSRSFNVSSRSREPRDPWQSRCGRGTGVKPAGRWPAPEHAGAVPAGRGPRPCAVHAALPSGQPEGDVGGLLHASP